MEIDFMTIAGRGPKLFKLGEEVHVFCDWRQAPKRLQHLANAYCYGRVAGFVNECSAHNAKIAVSVSGGIIHAPANSFAVLNAAEFKDVTLENLHSNVGNRALRRSREFHLAPHPLPAGIFPELMEGDSVVAFCPPTTTVEILPELTGLFVTGRVHGFHWPGQYATVRTDLACKRPTTTPGDNPHIYPYDVTRSNPMIIWRGHYEQLRLHPDWVEAYLDRFPFPLCYGETEISREEFTKRLRESFGYITMVKYNI